jgi:hypothetical protein
MVFLPTLHSKTRILSFVREVTWYAAPSTNSRFFRIRYLRLYIARKCHFALKQCLAPFWRKNLTAKNQQPRRKRVLGY